MESQSLLIADPTATAAGIQIGADVVAATVAAPVAATVAATLPPAAERPPPTVSFHTPMIKNALH